MCGYIGFINFDKQNREQSNIDLLQDTIIDGIFKLFESDTSTSILSVSDSLTVISVIVISLWNRWRCWKR